MAGITSAKFTLATASSVCLNGNKVMEPGLPREISGLQKSPMISDLKRTAQLRMRQHQTSGASLRWLVRSAGFGRGRRFLKISSIFLNFPQFSSNFLEFSSTFLARKISPNPPPPLPPPQQLARGDITTNRINDEQICEVMSTRARPWSLEVPLLMSFHVKKTRPTTETSDSCFTIHS